MVTKNVIVRFLSDWNGGSLRDKKRKKDKSSTKFQGKPLTLIQYSCEISATQEFVPQSRKSQASSKGPI